MKFPLNVTLPFYSPEDVIEPVVDDVIEEEVKKTDMEVLNEDEDEDKDDDDTEEEEDESPEEKDEVDEEEIVRMNWQELKEKYPELAKDPKFKILKNTVYREQEYTKLFPNPKDAEEALNAQANYDDLRDLVLSGDTEKLINNIKDVSEKSLTEFAANFLPALRKADDKLYVKVTTPLIRRILKDVVRYGENHDHKETGENFIKAARVVSKAVFDDYELGKVEDFERPKEKDEDLEKDKNEFFSRKEKDLLDSLLTDTDKELDNIIGDVDPGKLLKDRPKLKARILTEIKDEVRKALHEDKGHLSRMDGLWARERRSGYSGALKDSIKTTFMSRAKVLMPEIRKRIRSEYLGNVKDSDKKLKESLDTRDKNLNPGGRANNKNKIPTAKEAKEKGITSRQLLDM